MSVRSVGPRVGGEAVRIGAYRKAKAVSPKANPPRAISETEGGRTSPPRAPPNRRMPKSGSSEPEGQPAERKNQLAEGNLRNGRRKNQSAQRPLRSGACQKAEAEARRPTAQRKPESKRPPRAVKTTQDERSPSAGRNRETRGRRSSADTPTNTIEKRDCDTLRPSEAS